MNSRFFTFPVNYKYGRQAFSVNSANVRTGAPEINDYDYTTSSRQKRLIIESFGKDRTTNSRITHIRIVGRRISTYRANVPSGKGSGTALAPQTIPTTDVVNGIQYALEEVGPFTATEVELNITGTNAEIIEVMLLEQVTNINNRYQAVNPTKVMRETTSDPNILGNTIKEPGTSNRWKESISYTAMFHDDANPSADDVRNFFEDPMNLNFTVAVDYSIWPDRVYPASLVGGIDISYVGGLYEQQQFDFTILES